MASPRTNAGAARRSAPEPRAAARAAAGEAALVVRPAAAPTRSRKAPQQPALRVVPLRARRRRAGAVFALVVLSLFAVMLGLAALWTQIAQDQLRLDRADRDLRVAQQQYERLRGQVAVLESPANVAAAAQKLGLVAPDPGTITYLTPSPAAVAAVAAATAGGPDAPSTGGTATNGEWSTVKSLVSGAP